MLAEIRKADQKLTAKYAAVMHVNDDLDRTLVSFQANRDESGHRWYKYREGFSADLIRYIIKKAGFSSGPVLDPFAGSGTALFISAEQGLDAIGIELLPSSSEIIELRSALSRADSLAVMQGVADFLLRRSWLKEGPRQPFQHLRITAGAFPEDTERQLGRYLHDAGRDPKRLVGRILRFAALCVLEEISFTRKDGQYLRWDQRSGRCLGKSRFDKGRIPSFDEAIAAKLKEMIADLSGRATEPTLFTSSEPRKLKAKIDLRVGSCLDVVPTFTPGSIAGVITSPPYCNRYDYTRTYALELAALGIGEDGVRKLRQTMLSCTVENRDKKDLPSKFGPDVFREASQAFGSQRQLELLLRYLEQCKKDETINNPGIVRMVKNYFFEMSLLIFSLSKCLKPAAPFVMVNDNVRYQGAHVPVDLILSDFAQQAGLCVESIWVLPRGKGNSSQQMGVHGREEIRKCVYVWRKKGE